MICQALSPNSSLMGIVASCFSFPRCVGRAVMYSRPAEPKQGQPRLSARVHSLKVTFQERKAVEWLQKGLGLSSRSVQPLSGRLLLLVLLYSVVCADTPHNDVAARLLGSVRPLPASGSPCERRGDFPQALTVPAKAGESRASLRLRALVLTGPRPEVAGWRLVGRKGGS